MEENTNSTIPFYFPKEYKSIVSIIGIGGGAGRIVNEMQVHEFLKRYLYVFDMNRKEMEELSLLNRNVKRHYKVWIGLQAKFYHVLSYA